LRKHHAAHGLRAFQKFLVIRVPCPSSLAVSTSTPRRRNWSVIAWGT
jgi:hypothetical protein